MTDISCCAVVTETFWVRLFWNATTFSREGSLDGVGPMRCQDSLGSDVLTVIVIEQEDVDEAAQRE